MNTLKPPAASESSLDMLYQRPGFLLRRAHQLSVALFDLHCGALNLTPPQYGVLTVLSHAQGI
ncbi:MAG: MarR family transcriptional regulator, partial [Ottowia sp.]|nr:MarR family transcriptional regulator [Ottowia sp.]